MTLNESVESIDGAPELSSLVSSSASVQSVAGAPPISEEGAEGVEDAKGVEDATGEQDAAPPSDEASAPPATPPTSVTKADARS